MNMNTQDQPVQAALELNLEKPQKALIKCSSEGSNSSEVFKMVFHVSRVDRFVAL